MKTSVTTRFIPSPETLGVTKGLTACTDSLLLIVRIKDYTITLTWMQDLSESQICYTTNLFQDPGHSGIPGNEEADRQANGACKGRGSIVQERVYISVANRTRRTSEHRAVAKIWWEEQGS